MCNLSQLKHINCNMQILQKIFNISAQEPPRSIVSNSSSIPRKQGKKDQSSKSKDIVVFTEAGKRQYKRVESSKLKCENLILFGFLQRKDVSKPFFYHTLNLRRVGSFGRRPHSANMTKEEEAGTRLEASNKADSATHNVGNKVLPISDSVQSSEKKEKTKGDKNIAISRMRELIKWAAFTKGGKYRLARKVLNLKNIGGLKSAGDDEDEFSNDSPKISFRWELEICSTTSSVCSKASSAFKNDQIHVRNQCADGIYGSWITTDSEFVVLEL